jgi:hypothetical protein
MKPTLEFLITIAGQVLYIGLLIGAALAVLFGILLLFDSTRALRWNAYLKQWVSTEGASRALDELRDVKRFLYRAHRIAGVLVVGGALYALNVLFFSYRGSALARVFRDVGNVELMALIFESLRLFLVVGNVAALVLGLVLCFRPSLLKGLEAWADRTYTVPLTGERLDGMRLQPDQAVSAHPKLIGVVAAAAGAYILLNLGVMRLV